MSEDAVNLTRDELEAYESLCREDPARLLAVFVGGDSLGFAMIGGPDGVVVAEVRAGSAADHQGVTQGMLLESINGVSTQHKSKFQCVALISEAGDRKVLVFRRTDDDESGPPGLDAESQSFEESSEERERRIKWIRFYVREGMQQEALELGWDGKPFLRSHSSLASIPPGTSEPVAERKTRTVTVPCKQCDAELRFSADCPTDGGVVSQIICPRCNATLEVRIKPSALRQTRVPKGA